ncbi:PREDICTED: contactin-6 [Vollenhovia emeryi]|uniref:contactin-6 n=1 Tax=Vollenhovia emeryi TaxID=411798 RepID=UPI0005F47A49|nr:PREDICTED: contactin-6 [Vollenhovia emeryi]
MDERKLLLPLLMLLLAGWQGAVAVVPMRYVAVDVGKDLELACAEENAVSRSEQPSMMWVREGREDGQIERLKVEPNGMLKLSNVSVDDAGNYSCTLDDDRDAVKTMINVTVRTPPRALQNVWVKPSTILANILWEVDNNGGYPIIEFTAEYRLKPVVGEEPEEWKPIWPIHIPPNSRQIDVYHLVPNTTYSFRVWATNQLGRGEIVEVEGHTQYSIEELELARHLLAGVENFDTRVWVAAVGIVMGTLLILGLGTCYLLYRECKAPSQLEEQEVIELVPNIILNPGFFDERTEHVPQDENFNNQTTTRLNNNSVVQPRRL